MPTLATDPTSSPAATRPSDLVCVYDFAGSITYRGHHEPSNIWADYSPSEGKTYLGGQWRGMKPMECRTEPTEDQVWEYACAQDHPWANRHRARVRRDAEFEARMKDHERHYARHGYNFAEVEFATPTGPKNIFERVGRRDFWNVFRNATNILQTKFPAGTRLKRFRLHTGCSEEGKGGATLPLRIGQLPIPHAEPEANFSVRRPRCRL